MRRRMKIRIKTNDRGGILGIQETLVNTGSYELEREPRSKALSKEIFDVLKRHNLIADNDDYVNIDIIIGS